MEFLTSTFLGNEIGRWLIAIGTGLVTHVTLRIVVGVVAGRLEKLTSRTSTSWDDLVIFMVRRTKFFFLFLLAVFVAAQLVVLPDRLLQIVQAAVVLGFLLQAGVWLNAAVTFWLEESRKKDLAEDRSRATTVGAMAFVVRLAVWSIVLLLGLDNLGIDVTALITGLGIGGIAIALAVQNILGDLFSSLSIILDKPFLVGDFLIIDDLLGTVETIGLKTTRIRSLSGEQLIFSNSDLLRSRIRNYGRMFQRRVLFSVGVTYQTPRAKLQKMPGILREAVEAQEKTRFDRAHFKAYGDFSLVFEVVYFVLEPDYNLYMDIQQAVNFAIHERFEAEGIEFAYPTQTLYFARAGR
ncbi:MAG: mechanosensitive ion channel [Candidatus Eisenbacteria bacterium]|nr:mechanosensitive ion channel [Candidatus Latescibacterota bacterium]MBD3302082.1 mechanosensitive ion channel [Candidatus Eisenbacteria bacterium]